MTNPTATAKSHARIEAERAIRIAELLQRMGSAWIGLEVDTFRPVHPHPEAYKLHWRVTAEVPGEGPVAGEGRTLLAALEAANGDRLGPDISDFKLQALLNSEGRA